MQRGIPYAGFKDILDGVAAHSPLLARYIHKYFYDMVEHFVQLHHVVRTGGLVYYVIGNSKFYDVLVPTELIITAIMEGCGFIVEDVQKLRKRTSKKELFEYVVTGKK